MGSGIFTLAQGNFETVKLNFIFALPHVFQSNVGNFRLEVALRAYDPSVSVPYWDSTLDESLPVPKDSVLWTEDFMGDGNGNIYTHKNRNKILPQLYLIFSAM